MVQVTVKRWGNSCGVILPAQLVREHGLAPGDTVEMEFICKVLPISELFGKFKLDKSAQELKDEMRRGWDD